MRGLFKKMYFSKVQRNISTFGLGLIALSTAAVLSACSDTDKTAGGGPSGTDAGNAIMAQLTVDGQPAAFARVKLSESESLDAADNEFTKADKNGKVVFENVAEGTYTLEARLDGKALQKEVSVEGSDVDLGKEALEETVSIAGSVGDGAEGTVKVRGMAHSAKVKDGKFSMDSLPAGPISLVFIPNKKGADTSSTYMKVIAGESSTASTFAEESRALLLDDFQDSNYQNRFMPARTYDGGWWYFDYNEETVTPKFTDNGSSHRFSLESEDGNIVAHVAATFGEAVKDSSGETQWPWATVGIELGKSDKSLCNDISSVDSIAFRTKGEGAIVFGLIDETQSSQIIAQSEFTLGDKWERISIPLADILDPQFSYTCVNQLVWSFKPNNEEKTVNFWLDDIELTGGKRLSIWKR
ncbi:MULTISPECIES: hypothetical protein [unclassified Fibrobacter]|jgi:hypothetical protein|uniref:hypothetical protein n=1 Tax=unclassified Fibrobacter TaxID=2634177 RepID=UPI0025B83A72|nr:MULTISPECIES: hypothetical protein [unclassified Fibrobacter]